MRTMLDIAVDYGIENCKNSTYVPFENFFEVVEKELRNKWELEAEEKEIAYETLRVNKIGELYRLLTVDSRFVRDKNENQWTTRMGFN